MNSGMGGDLNKTVEAYRGRESELEQKYSIDQQLIDLLALQKLKSEKDAAATQMQAQMQNNPANIQQQLEQEMLQRTKQDVMQQVGSGINLKNAQQQKAMQQAPQMAQQAQQGVAGLQQQLQGRQPQRMASGGIVQSYKEGGGVQPYGGQSEAEFERNLRGQEGLTEEELKQKMAMFRFTQGYYKGLGNTLNKPRTPEPEGIVAQVKTPPPQPPPQLPSAKDEGILTQAKKPDVPTFNMLSGSSTSSRAPAFDMDGLMSEVDSALSKAPEMGQVDPADIQKLTDTSMDTQFGKETTKQDITAQANDEYESAMKQFKYNEQMSGFDKQIARMEEMYSRQNDPKKQRRREMQAFLTGFAGTSDIGVGFARATANSIRVAEQSDDQERNALMSLANVMKNKNASANEIVAASKAAAGATFKSLMAERAVYLGTKGSRFNTFMATKANEVAAEYKQENANVRTKVDALVEASKQSISNQANMLRQQSNNTLSEIQQLSIASKVVSDTSATIQGVLAAISADPANRDLVRLAREGDEGAAQKLTLLAAHALKRTDVQQIMGITAKVLDVVGVPSPERSGNPTPELPGELSSNASQYE